MLEKVGLLGVHRDKSLDDNSLYDLLVTRKGDLLDDILYDLRFNKLYDLSVTRKGDFLDNYQYCNIIWSIASA
ncbi:hypothetical protein AGMMS50268_35340 [Spirochaetia bacterium]|nr:hypothetical protein AGMMS50268_35340 [Spirochaetia bacterium]